MRLLNGQIARFLGRRPWWWPTTLSVLAAAVLLLAPPALAPRQWEELSVAFGLRPPSEALSGVWRLLFAGLGSVLSPDVLVLVLWLTGACAVGCLVFLCDRIFDWLIPPPLRGRLLATPDGLFWKRLLTGTAALLFVCSDGVWSACQAPGAALCQIVVTMAAVGLLVGLLRRGRHYGLPVVAFTLGLLTGDGLFAALVFAVLIVYLRIRASGKVGRVANELSNPIVLRAVTARTVCGYLVGLAASLVANVAVYRGFGGVARTTTEVGDVLQAIVGDPLASFVAANTPGACVFMLVIVIIPLGIVRFAIPRLWPQKGESTALFLIPVGIAAAVALSQLTGFGCAAVWLASVRRAGAFAQAVWAFGGLMAVVWGLLAIVTRARSVTDARFRRGLLAAASLAVVAMAAGSLPTRISPSAWRLQEVVDAYCREVADECALDGHLVTDGTLDTGVELAVWRQGRRLICLSAVSGGEPHEVKLRQRGMTDAEDLAALESGAADALREWLDIRTNGLAGVAAQAGFDRRRSFDEALRPRFSGLVAHFGGTEGPAERTGRQTARTIGRRVVDLCRRGKDSCRMDPSLTKTFRLVQWRLAVACRQRLENPKTAVPELVADTCLADELDRLNPSLGTIRRRYGWQTEHHSALILPREGVRIALAKKDFRLASAYAERVIRMAPDDAEANFALGMNHYLNRQFARAVPHLQRVLEAHGENPGVLNNLAMAYLRLERWQEAVDMAERAIRSAPDDAALRESAERILGQVRGKTGNAVK